MLFDFEPADFERDGRDWPNREASRFVEAAGIRWHVQAMGEGPTLLLIHGTAGATHSWRDLMPILARRFHVVAPDLPGHGFTAQVPNSRLGLPDMARAVAGLAEVMEIAPLVVIGHSAGGAIAIRMALDGLLVPAGIVGLNPALFPFGGIAEHLFPTIARALVLNPFVPRIFAGLTGPAGIERLITDTGSRLDARGIELYRRLIARSGHCAAALGMMARWELGPLVADLPKLATRLDIIVGANDLAVPPADAERVRALLPETHVLRLDGLGHLAHEEAPDRVAGHLFAIADALVAGAASG